MDLYGLYPKLGSGAESKGCKTHSVKKPFLASNSDIERRNRSIISKGCFATSSLSPHLEAECTINFGKSMGIVWG